MILPAYLAIIVSFLARKLVSFRDLVYYFQRFMYKCVVLDLPLNELLPFGATFILSADCEEEFPKL